MHCNFKTNGGCCALVANLIFCAFKLSYDYDDGIGKRMTILLVSKYIFEYDDVEDDDDDDDGDDDVLICDNWATQIDKQQINKLKQKIIVREKKLFIHFN